MTGTRYLAGAGRWYMPTMVGPILLAWVLLALWLISPYARLLNHAAIADAAIASALRHVAFLGGWLLMFAVHGLSLAWMGCLALLMITERASGQLTRPLGLVLLLAGALALAGFLPLPA